MVAENELPKLADKLKPYIVPWLPRATSSNGGGGGGALVAHDIGGPYHSGTLRNDQATQFALLDGTRPYTGNITFTGAQTVDGVDLSAHVADANAHHAQATIGANSGLTLAGQLFNMGTPGGLSATSTSAVSGASHTHAIDSTIARSAITVTGAGALGSGGDLTGNRTITMNTPGSLSVVSSNSSSTNHTHAVASSSNPGAAASLLASTGAGGLTLVTLTTSGAITGAPSSNTAHTLGYAKIGYIGHSGYAGFAAEGFASTTGYALIQSATSGDLYLNTPTGRNGYIRTGNNTVVSWNDNGLVAQSGKYIGSSGYVSGWAGSGWRADQNISFAGESFAEFDNLSIRGTLSVYELVINQIRATNGTLIVSSAGKIDSVSGSVWTFEDPKGSNVCSFAANDIVIIQDVDVDSTTLVRRIVRRVSSVSTNTITVTAASGGPTDVGTPRKGDTVVRIGNSTNAARQGVVLITSDMANSPYQDVISGVTSWADWTGGTKTKIRMGHLSGITGTANEYGLIAGNSGFTASDSWVKFSSSEVKQNNVRSVWQSGGLTLITVDTSYGLSLQTYDKSGGAIGYGDQRMITWGQTIPTATPDGAIWTQSSTTQNETYVEARAVSGRTGFLRLQATGEAASGNYSDSAYFTLAGAELASTRSYMYLRADDAQIDLGNGSANIGDFTLYSRQVLLNTGTGGADGSASVPAISFLNDTDTGIYRNGPNQLNFSAGGSNCFQITSSAVTSQIQFNVNALATIASGGSGGSVYFATPGGASGFAIYNTNRADFRFDDSVMSLLVGSGTGSPGSTNGILIDTSGRVGIKTSSLLNTFSVAGNTYINQNSSTLADATLKLNQADVSEEFIDFQSTVGTGNAVNTDALGSYYGRVRVAVNGTFKWLALYS